MPIEKPKKPTELVPRAFGGIKNNFSDDLQSTGFEPNIPQTYNGDNLNYHLDATGKELDYVEKIVDFINQAPVNHIPFVNENNQLDYVNKDELGGGGGYNLGDTKITDHILKGDEAKGMALQGTYVSGALYPDFYNKWLEQYKNSQAITTYTPQDITFIGSVTNNDWVVGNFSTSNYIKIEKNLLNIASNANNFEIVAKITTGSDVTTRQEVIVQGVSESALGYNGLGIQIQDSCFSAMYSFNNSNQATGGTYVVQPNTTYYLKYEFTGSAVNLYYALEKDNWILDVTKATTTKLQASNYDFVIGAWRKNNTTSVFPFLGTVDLKETYIKVDGEDWFIPLATETYYQNANKRRFYPIAEKPKYDEMYETYGIADFYGIDEENERIFLPRDDWFAVTGTKGNTVSAYGNGMTLGLTDGTSYAGMETGSSQVGYCLYGISGVYGTPIGTNESGSALTTQKSVGVTNDPTKSGIIADNPVKPNTNKYLYYCVGNTVVNDSEINAGALVAEMEQKANTTLDNVMPTQEFKNQSMLWGLPDYENAITVFSGANDSSAGKSYIAPDNGIFIVISLTQTTGRANTTISVNGVTVCDEYSNNTQSGFYARTTGEAYVSKGDSIAYACAGRTDTKVQFIPLKGAN